MRSKRGAVERVGRKREGGKKREYVERIREGGGGRRESGENRMEREREEGKTERGQQEGEMEGGGGGLGKPWGGKGEQEPPLLSSVAFNCQRSLRNV